MNPARFNRREVLATSAIALTWRFSRATSASDDLEDTVRWIVTTPREGALRRGARELTAGLDSGRLLGALLVAAARDIRTDLPTFNHAALSVSAIDQLAGSASMIEQQHCALWCLDYFKEAQEAEARRDDWRMTPVEPSKLPSGAAARSALVDALERWDRAAADVALVGFVRSAPLDEVYALVWEYGTRCVDNIGHKGIYAALSRRALPLAGERYAEDVLRSVVSSFFIGGRSELAAPFERSRELVAHTITPRAQRSSSDSAPGHELLGEIRKQAPDELPQVAAKLIADGVPPAVLFDAIVTAACEVVVAKPGVAPLHALTSTNSLHYIALHAPSERVAQLALLQAAAWVAHFRRSLDETAAALRVDAIEATESSLDSVLSDDPEHGARMRGALWLGAHEFVGFTERTRRIAQTTCDDVHEFKLTAAALEEARLASSWVRPFVCGALALHLPSQCRPDGARLQRVSDALAVAPGH